MIAPQTYIINCKKNGASIQHFAKFSLFIGLYKSDLVIYEQLVLLLLSPLCVHPVGIPQKDTWHRRTSLLDRFVHSYK